MARFTHRDTGSTINVADEKVGRLGPEWVPVKDEPKAKAPAKPSARSKKS